MSVEIKRTWNIEEVKEIIPHLIFTDNRIKDAYVSELSHYLMNSPNSLQILIAKDEGELIGFTISHDPGWRFPFLKIAQAWITPTAPNDLGDRFLSEIIVWAQTLGKEYIRAETTRSPDALLRKYNFKTMHTVVRLDLEGIDLFDEMKRRSIDGRLLRTRCGDD